jgi:protein involved in polysaccharide export with SLBB domain
MRVASHTTRAAVFFVAAAAFVLGCGTGTRYSTALPTEVPTQNEFALGAGDTFEVTVYDEPKLSGPYRVASDGTIHFPLLGTVKVEGMLPQDLAQELQKRLLAGYLRSPQVSILVKDLSSKKIIIIGQVSKPGTITYAPNMSIVEAITVAGGFTPMALKNSTTITRVEQGTGRKVSTTVPVADISEGRAGNYYLRPGDIVSVPERIF